LVEAVNACIAHISLLEDKAPANDDSKLRSELRELKKAVFVDAAGASANAHGSVPDDTQDYLDRSDIGFDAILKLAAEQNGTPVASATPVSSNADATPPPVATSVGEDDARLDLLLFTQVKAEAEEKEAEFKLVTAKRASQLARQQAAAAKKDRQRLERQQERKHGHAVRRAEYERKWGYPPNCPRYNRSKECDGTQCKYIGKGNFSHPNRCMNPAHVVKGLHGDCLLWHFWDKVKSAEFAKKQKGKTSKVTSNTQRRTKDSNNGAATSRRRRTAKRP
jgi:hypothetical protein